MCVSCFLKFQLNIYHDTSKGHGPQVNRVSREGGIQDSLLESVMITSVIDAKEGRDVAIIDIPNAFVQTKMEGKRVIMKMQGKLAELLVEIAPEV